jgi:restriction endonuclease S subunit
MRTQTTERMYAVFAKSAPQLFEKIQLEYKDIAIVIVGATIGKVAIFNSHLKPCNFNENMARISIRDTRLDPEYLLAYLQSNFGQAYIKWLTGGAAQAKLSLERIEKIEIPIPPHRIQDRIAQVMQDAYVARRAKLAEAEQLFREIDGFVLRELGINLADLQSHRVAIKPISTIAGGRFDFEAVVTLRDIKFGSSESVELREVVEQINERITPAEVYPDAEISYVGLGDIVSNTGELGNFTQSRGSDVLSASPMFKKDDILFGRMRPYLNKVWLAEFDGICSGEAIVLRPNAEKVDLYFLYTLLLSRITLNQVVPLQSGTSLPRVSASDVLSIKLPIPKDSQVQQKIGAEVARRRAKARRLRAEAETIVAEAKARVERMILGEEAAE